MKPLCIFFIYKANTNYVNVLRHQKSTHSTRNTNFPREPRHRPLPCPQGKSKLASSSWVMPLHFPACVTEPSHSTVPVFAYYYWRVGREMESETGAAAYHRKTHVCFLQSRPVVGAITCDRHHLSLFPNRAVNDAWERQTPSVSPPVACAVAGHLASLVPTQVFFPDPAITSLPADSPLPSAGRARPSPKGSALSKKVDFPHTAPGAPRQLLRGTKPPHDLKADTWGQTTTSTHQLGSVGMPPVFSASDLTCPA